MLRKFTLICAYCGKKLGIAYTEDLPFDMGIPLSYCSTEHDEAHNKLLKEEGIKAFQAIIDELKNSL